MSVDVTTNDTGMNAQMTFQRICALSGVICLVVFFGGFVVAGFLPPLSPGLSAAEVAGRYQANPTGIRIGAGMILISSMFYAVYTAVMSGQMQRIPGVHQTVVFAQLVAGAFACLTFLVPAMLFAVTSFRPERAPDSTLLLNDMSWIFLVIAWPPFMAQYLSFAFAILSDRGPNPVFPRWIAYVSIWAAVTFIPATVLPFFKSGPFAWNGIVPFWLGGAVFAATFIVNTIWLLKAIKAESSQASNEPAAAGLG